MAAHLLSIFFTINIFLLGLDCSSVSICRTTICKYEFVVSRAQTMTYVHPSGTVFNVAVNGSSLVVVGNSLRSGEAYRDVVGMTVDPRHVITADGYPRDVILVNNQFPGPTIEVLEGAQVVVRVRNSLFSEVISVHWHGMHMRNNNYMDGVPYVTQCPILPRQEFTYTFTADPPGTHWYHSHHNNQRIDGLYGMLIVHRRHDDVLPSHGIFVTDWRHQSSDAMALRCGTAMQSNFTGEILRHPTTRHYSVDGVELSSLSYVSSLMGGRGRYDGRKFPLEVYSLTSGLRQVFRLVNAAADFSFEISADQHVMDIIALDGYDIQPIRVDSAIVHPGESVDFEILANQAIARYWLRAKTLLDSTVKFNDAEAGSQEVRAILEYKDSEEDKVDPRSEPRSCTESHPCLVFNCPFPSYPKEYNRRCVHVHEVIPRYDPSWLRQEFGLDDTAPQETFVNFAFTRGSSVNGRKFVPPKGFDHLDPDWHKHFVPCDEDALAKKGCCSCTNVLSLPLGITVQMVLMNFHQNHDDKNLPSHHAIHIHGHSFAVMASGYGPTNATNGRLMPGVNADIICDPPLCSRAHWANTTTAPTVNTLNPPIKDTVLVPAQGYVVIRFRTDNPGRWMIHCHQELHFLKGMAILLEEGSRDECPRAPEKFPTCGDFVGEDNVTRVEEMALQTTKWVEPASGHDRSEHEGLIVVSRGVAAGTAVGLLLLGAFLAVLLISIKDLVVKYVKKRQEEVNRIHPRSQGHRTRSLQRESTVLLDPPKSQPI